jgi:hypothetical protein
MKILALKLLRWLGEAVRVIAIIWQIYGISQKNPLILEQARSGSVPTENIIITALAYFILFALLLSYLKIKSGTIWSIIRGIIFVAALGGAGAYLVIHTYQLVFVEVASNVVYSFFNELFYVLVLLFFNKGYFLKERNPSLVKGNTR